MFKILFATIAGSVLADEGKNDKPSEMYYDYYYGDYYYDAKKPAPREMKKNGPPAE